MKRKLINLATSAALILAPAAIMITASAEVAPASAHERDCWPPGHCKHKHKGKKGRDRVVVVDRPVYVAPQPQVVYAPPPVVYAPPPIVVAPPRPAGVHLGVDIPLR